MAVSLLEEALLSGEGDGGRLLRLRRDGYVDCGVMVRSAAAVRSAVGVQSIVMVLLLLLLLTAARAAGSGSRSAT